MKGKLVVIESEEPAGELLSDGLIRILAEGGTSRAEILDAALLMVRRLLHELDSKPPLPIGIMYGYTTRQEAIRCVSQLLMGSATMILDLLEPAPEGETLAE